MRTMSSCGQEQQRKTFHYGDWGLRKFWGTWMGPHTPEGTRGDFPYSKKSLRDGDKDRVGIEAGE